MTAITSTSAGSTSPILSTDTVAEPLVEVVDQSSNCLAPQASAFDGPTGSVALGDTTYDVKDGRVSVAGKEIGTCDDSGNFKVSIGGQEVCGNVGELVGAAVEATLSTGEEVDNRPNGSVKIGLETYEVDEGIISKNGERLGTMGGDGRFNLDGQTGSVADLAGAVIQGTLADGTKVEPKNYGGVQNGTDHFAIRNGEVFYQQSKIGTIDEKGNYNVNFKGKDEKGNLAQLDGASFAAALSDGTKVSNAPQAARINIGDKSFVVLGGQVLGDNSDKVIGSINDQGRFNVTIDGKQHIGNLQDVAGANYWAWLSDGTKVSNLPNGTVSFGQTDYQVKNGRVFVGEADVGFLDKSGHFEVTADNRKYSGNLAELTGAAMKGHLGDNHEASNQVSGSVSVNGSTFKVANGQVFGPDGKRIGSVNKDGDYNVAIAGRQVTGNVTTTPGARWTVTG